MNEELLLILAGSAALLVRVGMALFGAGHVRSKNASTTILRQAIDLCVSALVFWAVGLALLWKQSGALFTWNSGASAAAFSYATTVLIGTGIVGGVFAERSRMSINVAASVLLAGVVLPLAGQWVWSDWVYQMYRSCVQDLSTVTDPTGWSLHVPDVAGASAIHFAAALCAAVGTVVIGGRNGKYNHDGSANAIPGHSVPMASVGVLLMLVGWLPYMLGNAAMHQHGALGRTALNVLLAGAAGGLAGAIYGQIRYGKPEVLLTYGGLLGGLVAISGAGGTVAPVWAVVIGLVAGLIVPSVSLMLDLMFHIDDPSGGLAIHGVGGLWGALAVPLLSGGGFGLRMKLLYIQVMGLLAIAILSVGASLLVFWAIKKMMPVRSNEADEYDGLDLSEHDINSYPDFQQNTIKSYHLREA